jgi:hypothetical protein
MKRPLVDSTVVRIPHSAPDLKIPRFSCDEPLALHLNKCEWTKACLNRHQTTIVLGIPGSGKTSLMQALFKSPLLLNGVFDKIYRFIPGYSMNSIDSEDVFSSLPDDQIIGDLTGEELNKVVGQLAKMSNDDKEREKALKREAKLGKPEAVRQLKRFYHRTKAIVYDDVQASLKDKELTKALDRLINNRRHFRVSQFILLQNFFALPKFARENATNIVVFHGLDKQQLKKLFEQVMFLEPNEYELLQREIPERHDFFVYNVSEKRIFLYDGSEVKFKKPLNAENNGQDILSEGGEVNNKVFSKGSEGCSTQNKPGKAPSGEQQRKG